MQPPMTTEERQELIKSVMASEKLAGLDLTQEDVELLLDIVLLEKPVKLGARPAPPPIDPTLDVSMKGWA